MRGLGAAAVAVAIPSACALAQGFPGAPAPASPPGANPICQRLEAQLVAIDRGDPARADQTRRYEEAAARQQAELDRTIAQARRAGCEGSGFFLFGGQPAQCGPLNNQIQQMRDNLDRITSDLQRLQGASANYERDGQRRAILAALGRNDCGPQYRAAATQPAQRGFFDTLFGNNSGGNNNSLFSPGGSQSGTYRTVCVRSCDGYFFPISFATTPDHFRDDERQCQRMCPAAEVTLYSYRNPGEEISQATSVSGGRLYTELPNAFKYRQEVNSACSCRRPGESWADALKNLDDRSTLERSDIVVTEERAKALSMPRDAQGRPLKPSADARSAAAAPQAAPAVQTPAEDSTDQQDAPKKPVRSVGPQLFPVR